MATGNGPEKPWNSYCVKQPDKHAILHVPALAFQFQQVMQPHQIRTILLAVGGLAFIDLPGAISIFARMFPA